MGISPAKVKQSRHVFENMLGLIQGRVYYNLQNWYRLIRLFPGFQYNSQFMESMMGIKEPLVLEDPLPDPTFWQKWFVELPALVRLLGRGAWNFVRIRSIVDRFERNFREHYDRWDAMDFKQLPPHEIKQLYDEMEEALLWDWKAPIINDFYVMIYYGLLKHCSKKWCHDPTGALQNDLICGEGGVESAEPAKMLLRLAGIASRSEPLKSEIVERELEALPALIKSNSDYDEFNQLMAKYLDLYGFRCMNELKLEEYSLRDRPHVVYQVLRNYLSLDDSATLDVDAMHEREQKIRRDAEATAFSSIQGFSILPRKWIFKRVLRNARRGVKNRENMRFARTRIYGLLRELIRSMGQQMADEKILGSSQDIFYLTIDELWDFIKGTAVTARLNELATLRRAEFASYEAQPGPDDRFETFGFAYHKNMFVNHNTEPVVLEDGQLRGTGCCPGTRTEKVRVLRSPSDNLSLSGEILVAERTDPGWVPLYPAVSGILIERGSILSHSAVVAREMGIPTIVGIAGLLQHVADGDTVTMDGSSGIVQLGTVGE
jgi:pyruvate,water dikinase